MHKIFKFSIVLFMTLFVSFVNIEATDLNEVDSFNNIVVFIRFNDESTYQAPYNLEYYESLFNGVDEISLRDYYLEATYDQLTIDSYIPDDNGSIIFYTDTFDRSYYEPYDETSNPGGVTDDGQAEREHALLKRAIEYVDVNNLIPDEMDLDVNDDGELDSITFMISGEDNGWNALLWPHKWQLHSYHDYTDGFDIDAPSINGVHPYTYTFELLGNSTNYSNQVDVGVLAHETFHLLSAPDLYHYYEYLQVEPVGKWGLMEYNGNIPSHMLGYMKYQYGSWVDSVNEIKDSGEYTLYPLQDSPDNMYKINTGHQDQWIYLEYRDNDGLYESQLPETGLLVYRVDESVRGNDSGSYDEDGLNTDEVFIYRPGMSDIIAPIILEDTEDGVYIDGYVDEAALSETNYTDELGLNTDVHMFASNGELLEIGIYNVVEHDGYITFDVFLMPTIKLVTNGEDLTNKELILYDNHLMDYNVEVNNLQVGYNAYYTTDGTVPSITDSIYDGNAISIDAGNSTVKVAVYDQTNTLFTIIERGFTFEEIIESEHVNYGNLLDRYWYFDFGVQKNYSLSFDSDSFLEIDYDYLYIIEGDTTTPYTGNELHDLEIGFSNQSLLLYLFTDDFVDDGYGFSVVVIPEDDISIELNGGSNIDLPVNDTFTDQGYVLSGINIENYSVEVINDINDAVLGTYTVTYNVLNSLSEVVITTTRTINIIDDIAPVVVLNGVTNLEVEFGSAYQDLSVTATDNYDTNLTVVTTNTVDTNSLGTYSVTYTVTDDSGNETVLVRVVKVVDTIAPILTLNEGIDTVVLGSSHIDAGITSLDNVDDTLTALVTGSVDVDEIGIYTLTYTVTDLSGNQARITRIVTVIEDKTVEFAITCNDVKSTFEVGSNFRAGMCYVNELPMERDTTGILDEAGTYSVYHSLEVEGTMYTIVRQITLVEYNENYKTVLYFERKRDLV